VQHCRHNIRKTPKAIGIWVYSGTPPCASFGLGRNEVPQRDPTTGKGNSDVASLFGRIFRTILLCVALLGLIPVSSAQAAPSAAIVIDAKSGEVLYEKNADTRLHPASLTKMMTLYIVFQETEAGRLHLDDKITVSKNAAAQPPSRLGLKAGQKIAVRYLIRAAAVKSANDAAMALGDHISGSQEAFAKRMTKTARALGMNNTTFKNANGLTQEGHLSTARDMTILGRHLFYDFPQYYNIFSRRTADAGMAKVNNTNSRFLDAYEGADGIKTGYTVAAGFNLTASAQRGNKRIIATVFGGTSTAARNAKMKELMDLGFGAARNNVKEKVPEAAPLPEDSLVAEALSEIDEPGVEGGAAKTIRVSGEVVRSLRPKARPGVAAVVPDEVALAIADSVDGALDSLAIPAPDGTLEAQAQKLETATDAAIAEVTDTSAALEGLAVAPPEALAETAPPAGTLEAQALALNDDSAPAAQEEITDITSVRPLARPEETEVAPQEVVVAENTEVVVPVEEMVAMAEPEEMPVAEAPLAEETVALAEVAPEVTAVENVAGGVMGLQEETAPTRSAPIFETVEPALAVAEAEPEAQEVVVVKSTSGGRHWGVNVGDYASRGDAERALLKTALAESATLNQGLRKITQKSGSYHANFMGLTEEQADLACRRLMARGVPCETLGPT